MCQNRCGSEALRYASSRVSSVLVLTSYWRADASDLPKHRPNSMNNYGLILDDIGMETAMHALMRDAVSPFAQFLFTNVGGL